MKLTISVDDELLAKARDLARRRGITIEDVIREFLAEWLDAESRSMAAEKLGKLLRNTPGSSGGEKIRREDAYEGRV